MSNESVGEVRTIPKKTTQKEKPVAIRIAELKTKISMAVSECKLPPCVIEPIIGNIYNQVAAAAEKELAHELEEYNKEEG